MSFDQIASEDNVALVTAVMSLAIGFLFLVYGGFAA